MSDRLVVQLSITPATDFDELIDIENALTLAFVKDRAAVVESHALAGKAFNIHIVPRADPGAVVERIKATLAESGVLDEAVIARRGEGAKAWSVVWPAGYSGAVEA